MVSGEAAQAMPLSQVARSVKRAITRHSKTVTLEGDPDRSISADDAITAVLREVGDRARSRGVLLSEDSVRLGCPAMWTSPQRHRLLTLTQDAGIPVTDHTLIDEPIAAGVAWVSHRVHVRGDQVKGRLLVFDMGGGTLDVALLDVEASPRITPEISVLASSGIDEAGDRLDSSIAQDLYSMYGDLGVDLIDPEDATVEAVVLQEARRVKEVLSDTNEVTVAPRHPSVALPELRYSREQLEVAFERQLATAEQLVTAVVRESLMTNQTHVDPITARQTPLSQLADEIRYVLVVGGMSQIPAVARRLGELFPTAEVYDSAGVPADQAIVAGLADTASYERINLHRPGFDFVLDWDGQVGVPLYEAFTPFYPWWKALQQTQLYYENSVPARRLPAHGGGVLRIRSSAGNDVALRIDGQDVPGIPVPFGMHDVRLRMYPSGRVVLTDGKGKQHPLRINKWPVLRGKLHAVLEAERIGRQPPELPDLPYPHGPRHE